MKLRWLLRKSSLIVVMFLLALVVIGCSGIHWPTISWSGSGKKARTGFHVVPISNRDVAELSSDDIVKIMRKTGFTDEQILKLGTDLRNGLLLSGAAQIKKKKKVEAIYAIHGDYVFITTQLRGFFIYDIKNGTFGVGSPKS